MLNDSLRSLVAPDSRIRTGEGVVRFFGDPDIPEAVSGQSWGSISRRSGSVLQVHLLGLFPGFGPPGEDSLRASSRRYHFRLPRRARTFAKVRKDTFVVSHNKPSPARAPPVARSRVFDPGLLLGDQALHELGPFLLVSLDALVQQHLTDLRDGPLLLIRNLLNVPPELGADSEY